MKKIISMLLVFTVISMLGLTAFAGTIKLADPVNNGIYAEIISPSTGIYKVSVYLVGSEPATVTGLKLKLGYNLNEVTPCLADGTLWETTGKTATDYVSLANMNTLFPIAFYNANTVTITHSGSNPNVYVVSSVKLTTDSSDFYGNTGKTNLYDMYFKLNGGKTGITLGTAVYGDSKTDTFFWPSKGAANSSIVTGTDSYNSYNSTEDNADKGAFKIVDKVAFAKALTDAKAAHTAATEGTAKGQYTVGSKATFKTALDAADGLSGTATQAQINTATTALNTAAGIFEAAKILVDPASDPISSIEESPAPGTTIDSTTADASTAVTVSATIGTDTVTEVGVKVVGPTKTTYLPAFTNAGDHDSMTGLDKLASKNGKYAVVIKGFEDNKMKAGVYTFQGYYIDDNGENEVGEAVTYTKG